jgi:hypothetical protein
MRELPSFGHPNLVTSALLITSFHSSQNFEMKAFATKAEFPGKR